MQHRDPKATLHTLVSFFGRDWLNWDNETLKEELEKKRILVDDALLDQVNALKSLFLSDSPWLYATNFNAVVYGLWFPPVDFERDFSPTITAIARTLQFMEAVRPNQPFSSEVCAFIAYRAWESGLVWFPFECADRFLAKILKDQKHDEEIWKLRDRVKREFEKMRELKTLDEVREFLENVKDRTLQNQLYVLAQSFLDLA